MDLRELSAEELKAKEEEVISAIETKSWVGRPFVGITMKDVVARFENDMKKYKEGTLKINEQTVCTGPITHRKKVPRNLIS